MTATAKAAPAEYHLNHPTLRIRWVFRVAGGSVTVSRWADGWLTNRFAAPVAEARRLYGRTRAAGFVRW